MRKGYQTKILACAIMMGTLLSACNENKPKTLAVAASSGTSTTTVSSSNPNAAYLNKYSTKVILNRRHFYSNYSPNIYGCAGDAKNYFDPMTNLEVAVKPVWLKNISLDITNSNALDGASKALSCGLTGLGAAPASQCASFDDLQPNSGVSSRAVMIGGFGCTSAGASCSPTAILGDIWNLSMPLDSSQMVFGVQPGQINSASPAAANSIAWFGADYSEFDDKIYTYGGLVSDNATFTASTHFHSISFNSNGTVSTTAEILNTSVPITSSAGFTAATPAGFSLPTTTGSTLTYSPRRNPTTKTWNLSSTTATQTNEHQDHFLLVGGLDYGTNNFTNDILMYRPKGYTNDTSQTAPASGDVMFLGSSRTANATTATGNSMRVISSLSYSGSASAPFTATTGTIASFVGRGYHRTVYDPEMDRYYIYGGITGSSASPTATNELWFYDAPHVGRAPTSVCSFAKTPTGTALNSTGSATVTALGTSTTGLDILQNFISRNSIFPAGGCLQKVSAISSAPSARFEHSMAFDRDQRAMLVFGGCTQVTSISTLNTNQKGDPTLNCTSASLLNDTWLYVPPSAQEVKAQNPVNSGADVVGSWIQLSPSTSPTKRVSSSIFYDRGHHKYYLTGGYGCTDTACTTITTLNDVWEFTPPVVSTSCTPSSATCSAQGTWTKIKSHNAADTTLPTVRKGAQMVYANPITSYGDGFYTVMDSSCMSQGPIATSDPSVSKQYVGAIYVHLDRSYFKDGENVLINLKMLPMDKNSRLPGVSNNSTPLVTIDDSDVASSSDTAVVRVQALNTALKQEDQIMSAIQPRFHEFIAGTPIIGDTFSYAAGASGQITEKQILVPISVDSSINLIKIERVQGSMKFFELTVTKF